MKTMPLSRTLGLLGAAGALLLGCRKHDAQPADPPRLTSDAYVIGFDPCAPSKGLVLRLLPSSDTVAAYTLPAGVYVFPPALFQGYLNDFLFPLPERANYKVQVEYYATPADQQVHAACPGNVNLADFNRATKGKQITITSAQRAN